MPSESEGRRHPPLRTTAARAIHRHGGVRCLISSRPGATVCRRHGADNRPQPGSSPPLEVKTHIATQTCADQCTRSLARGKGEQREEAEDVGTQSSPVLPLESGRLHGRSLFLSADWRVTSRCHLVGGRPVREGFPARAEAGRRLPGASFPISSRGSAQRTRE